MDYDYDISDIFSALKLGDEYFAGPRTKRGAVDAKSSEQPPEKRQRCDYLVDLGDSDDSDDGPADIGPELLAFITERQKPVDTDDVKWNDELENNTMGLGLGDTSMNLLFNDDKSITALDAFEYEIEYIRKKKYASLYRVWGYRYGKKGDHGAYEKEIQEDPKYGGLTADYYHYLTNFSDVVFRTLENIYSGNSGEVVGDFGYLKLKEAATEDLPRIEALETMHNVLDRYMNEKDKDTGKTMFEIMQELSNEPLKHRTFAFAAVVFAAKALLAIYNRDYDVARNIAMLYVYRFKES